MSVNTWEVTQVGGGHSTHAAAPTSLLAYDHGRHVFWRDPCFCSPLPQSPGDINSQLSVRAERLRLLKRSYRVHLRPPHREQFTHFYSTRRGKMNRRGLAGARARAREPLQLRQVHICGNGGVPSPCQSKVT